MIEQIVQYPDRGRDLILSNYFRHSSNLRISNYEPFRASSSSILVRTTRIEEGSTLENPKNIKLTGVRCHTNLAKPFYAEEKKYTQESHEDESLDLSPTYSYMVNTISLDDEDFEINKHLLRKDFILKSIRKEEFGSSTRSIRTLEPSTKKNSTLT